MLQQLYRLFLAPLAKTEDERRRESILDVLLFGVFVFCLVGCVVILVNSLRERGYYTGISPLTMLVMTLVFALLYWFSRRGFHRVVAPIFIAIFFIFSTYSLVVWGIQLPQGILIYSLVIVMSGVLLSSRFAFMVSASMLLTLLFLTHLKDVRVLRVDTSWSRRAGTFTDALLYGVTFMLIATVAWLSNRETERSLKRARHSEAELRKERNLLEVKVRERTEELERTQVEKINELERFAEFGRLSSTLLHDMANPLTSVSIELEQLANTEYSHAVNEARKGIASMERYISAARRQLRNESEQRLFKVASEVQRVVSYLDVRAKTLYVELALQLDEKQELYGDPIRFDQIVSNLVANAIDAYQGVDGDNQRKVIVTVKGGRRAVIVVVEDKAVGIVAKDLPHIFDAFYTTKPTDMGSGLGLSITKQTVEEDFGGSISVRSTKGRGTCFTIKLPKP